MNILMKIVEALIICGIFSLAVTALVLVIFWYPQQKKKRGIQKIKSWEYGIITVLSLAIILVAVAVSTVVIQIFQS
ncbi:hypothetical protein MUN89_21645 [Halobacillus salinarum]|uniref:Uncharacterized protein n=1 Tax=Halobacillus salinarum TaxID=2932257 RepID=A0ABY4EIS0_9BACI|nr:hypothetical protein [Halobacillus salinarum]UOQ44393.1 hypothetical protein MUN89_21645 [Halobacillus salinarum]